MAKKAPARDHRLGAFLIRNAYTQARGASGLWGLGLKRPAAITVSRMLFHICIKQLTAVDGGQGG
jgi:hypothetical protein